MAGVDFIAVKVLERGGVEASEGETGGECCTKAMGVADCGKATSKTK